MNKETTEITTKEMTPNSQPVWINYKEQKPPYGEEVLAYHHLWIDEDFNPKGTRIGFRSEPVIDKEDDFTSAYWWDYQDCYMTISRAEVKDNPSFDQHHLECIEPEYWMEIPKFSNNK